MNAHRTKKVPPWIPSTPTRMTGTTGAAPMLRPHIFEGRREGADLGRRLSGTIAARQISCRLSHVRRYRLKNRAAGQGPRVAKRTGSWSRRLEHVMKRYIFDGRETIECLQAVVRTSVEQKRHLGGHGAFALAELPPRRRVGVVPDTRRARRASPRLFHDLARGRAYFLRMYAEDSYLERAVSDMGCLRQKEGEDERAIARRLRNKRACARGRSSPSCSSCISRKEFQR